MTDERAQVLAEVVEGDGSSVVRVEDPETVALELADVLEADLLDSPASFGDALEARLALVDARTRALTALALHARLHDEDGDTVHVVAEVAELRRLLDRIDKAAGFVDSSRGVLRERLSSGTGLAVHPDAIRKAALDVTEARAAVSAAQVTLAELEAARSDGDQVSAAAPSDAGSGPSRRESIVRAAGLFVVALGIGLVGFGLGAPIALVVPALALVWGIVLVARDRDDVADRHVASDHLAAVSALTDRAYGGVALSEPEELVEARRQLAAARDRERYTESAWTGLVGSHVDAGDVEQFLSSRDPQFRVGDEELGHTPTVRAAEGHRRRLAAQWKVAWWALDRPVPPVASGAAALDELEASGIERITIDTYDARSPLRLQEREQFEQLADGRSVDDLRAVADARSKPLVVLDEAGQIDGSELAARTAVLPADVRVVVVGPRPDEG